MTDMTLSGKKQLLADITDMVSRQERTGSGQTSALDYLASCELDFAKWQLLHKYVHGAAFRTNERKKRSDQWRDAVDIIREIGEHELLNWCLLQVEVAANRERGINDIRPRKNGPYFPLVLEFVADRKRKALAILHFASEGEKKGAWGVNSRHHTKTEEILNKVNRQYEAHDEGHKVLPWNRCKPE